MMEGCERMIPSLQLIGIAMRGQQQISTTNKDSG